MLSAKALVLSCSMVYFISTLSSARAIQCQGSAKYTLTFRAEWTSTSHPRDFPTGSDHFSRLVGCSHKASYVMWIPGALSSQGVKDVAERGRTGALNNEMDQQITLKTAFKKYQASGGIGSGTGTSSITNIEVNSEYPLASFITMIAPSPDWFVGVHDFDLCNTTSGKWLDSRSRDLPPYDAGTDSGAQFKSANSKTDPPENIHLLTNNTEGSFKGSTPVKRFGTFTFVKTFESIPAVQSMQPSSTVLKIMAGQTRTAMSIPMSMYLPTANVNMKISATSAQVGQTTTVLKIMEQSQTVSMIPEPMSQPTSSVNMKSSAIPSQVGSSNVNLPTENVSPAMSTATLIARTSAMKSTPTSTTTSSASLAKHELGLIYVVFALILVNLWK